MTPPSTIILPSPTEGRNGSEVRIMTGANYRYHVHEEVYITIQYGVPIYYQGYNNYDIDLSSGPMLTSLRLAGKEAVFRCVYGGGSALWWLQNYRDFTTDEFNPINNL